MDDPKRNIDELIKKRALKKSELEELGEQIARSDYEIVVAFIDLANSTAMKESSRPEEWLGIVYEFIRRLDQLAQQHHGTVVKRIGDEVMITFGNIAESESFLAALRSDEAIGRHDFKVAIDKGRAYHFRFLEHLEDDPYGPVVDRCARIAKLAKAGFVLASSHYVAALEKPIDFISVGKFHLKGIAEPAVLFVSPLSTPDDKYHENLVRVLNSDPELRQGYRSTARTFTADMIRKSTESRGKPFLARELINVPKLPLSFRALDEKRRNAPDKDEFKNSVVGMLVEWEGKLDSIKRNSDYVDLDIDCGDEFRTVSAHLPTEYWDLLKTLPKGTPVRVRGIIEYYSVAVTLNYCDIEILSEQR